MKRTLSKLASIFLTLAILLVGHGLQQTLLPLQGQQLGWDSASISLLGAAYFGGFILGCFSIPLWISRVGHVRVLAACSSVAIVAILLIGRWSWFELWFVMRAFTGLAFAGMYLVFESWLNDQTENSMRGSVMSFYGFLSVGALSLGQLFVGVELADGTALVATIFALSIIPVLLTRLKQPVLLTSVHPSFKKTYAASQVAPVVAGASGFVMGLIWSSGAVYCATALNDPTSGALFVLATLVGGAITQIPVGRLSDQMDRRWVILALSLVGLAAAVAGCFATASAAVFYVVGGLFGATAMPLYSLAIAHANDNAAGDFVSIVGALLLSNGLGAIAGPLAFSAWLLVGPSVGFLVITGVGYLVCGLWTLYRIRVHRVERLHTEPYQVVSRTTQGAMVMDPRAAHPED